MQAIDKSILRLINMTYTGNELEAMLKAWEVHPTYKTDCTAKRLEKEYMRRKYMKELLSYS